MRQVDYENQAARVFLDRLSKTDPAMYEFIQSRLNSNMMASLSGLWDDITGSIGDAVSGAYTIYQNREEQKAAAEAAADQAQIALTQAQAQIEQARAAERAIEAQRQLMIENQKIEERKAELARTAGAAQTRNMVLLGLAGLLALGLFTGMAR